MERVPKFAWVGLLVIALIPLAVWGAQSVDWSELGEKDEKPATAQPAPAVQAVVEAGISFPAGPICPDQPETFVLEPGTRQAQVFLREDCWTPPVSIPPLHRWRLDPEACMSVLFWDGRAIPSYCKGETPTWTGKIQTGIDNSAFQLRGTGMVTISIEPKGESF